MDTDAVMARVISAVPQSSNDIYLLKRGLRECVRRRQHTKEQRSEGTKQASEY
jgi:hypothetical protein